MARNPWLVRSEFAQYQPNLILKIILELHQTA
jgi:hypothetical protein